MIIEHVGIWVEDLESMLSFYTEVLGAKSGGLYENPGTGFRSYFVSLGEGARLELMSRPGLGPPQAGACAGYAHIALSLGSREAVDEMVAALDARDMTVESRARVTGDGYYEAVVLDPEGNRVELMA